MLDVIITSTCRKTIENTLESFIRNVSCFDDFRFIVNVDVRNPKYLDRLNRFLDQKGIRDVRINPYPAEMPRAHAEALNYLFGRIESPYYFHLEDDWVFLKRIDIDPLIEIMQTHDIDQIRFNKQRTKDYAWLYHISTEDIPKYRKPNRNTVLNGMNLVQTWVWSFNPSIGRASTVQSIMPFPVSPNPEKYLCHKYDEIYSTRGAFIWGRIGDKAAVHHIGLERWIWLKQIRRKILKSCQHLGVRSGSPK